MSRRRWSSGFCDTASAPENPGGRALKHSFAALHLLPRATAIAYMDVGEEREQGAEALPTKCALQLNASGLAETLLYYSEVPWHVVQ
ncbi:MAG TPA: hypothetical protein DCS89_06310 [Gammaproteobacteria bacterium]|nr:hypothetical protein [Gammaproteobacteria bacterium]